MLSCLAELSSFIKVQLDTHDGKIKERYELELNESIQNLIQRYHMIKDVDYDKDDLIEDFYTRTKLFISTQAKLL